MKGSSRGPTGPDPSLSLLSFDGSGSGVHVDLDQLLRSRLILQASSGGGKSWALRQLLEQTHGQVPQLVLDWEGEFASLRERFGYIYAAVRGGDVAVDLRTAAQLCRRLVQLGASTIIDLYDLPKSDRRRYARLFLEELMALPRDLWRPLLVVLDEGHELAPEGGHGESEALKAVVDLCSQGRKRGFCPVVATQRIGKFSKDAAAELQNKLIGLTTLDTDVKRAGEDLGFDKPARQQLQKLGPGEFFAVGPAISREVVRTRSGGVRTTHPEAGKVTAAPPPPPVAVKALLEQLKDLPREAETRERTVEALERQVSQLQRELAAAKKAVPAPPPAQRVEVPVLGDGDRAHLTKLLEGVREGLVQAGRFFEAWGAKVTPRSPWPGAAQPAYAVGDRRSIHLPGHDGELRTVTRVGTAQTSARAAAGSDSGLSKGARIVLSAIAQHPDGVTHAQIAVLTGYKETSRRTYLQQLRSQGMISGDEPILATPDGIAALGPEFEPLPTGGALLAYWRARLSAGELRVLEVLVDCYPRLVAKANLLALTQYRETSLRTYLQKLKARKLVEEEGRGSAVRASAMLFDGGGR